MDTNDKQVNNNGKQQIGYSEEKIFRILVGDKLKNNPPHGENHALAIDYDHMAIIKMDISPIKPLGNAPLLKFERVNLKVENKKPQDLWRKQDPKWHRPTNYELKRST